MKLSVIIPIYNAEKYLAECLDSVLDSDFTDFEVICVNDGSVDQSLGILKKYAQKDKRIKVFSGSNKGVSAARNIGLDNAVGRYIFFMDVDDFIHKDLLGNLYSAAEKYQLDMIYPQLTLVDSTGKFIRNFEEENQTEDIQDGLRHKRRGFVFALYFKEKLNDIRFDEKIYFAEDALFNIMVHTKAARIKYCKEAIYYYRQHSDSYSSEGRVLKSEKGFYGIIRNIEVLNDYCLSLKTGKEKEIDDYFNRPFYLLGKMALDASVIPLRSVTRLKKIKEAIKKINRPEVETKLSEEYFFYNKPVQIFAFYYGVYHIYKEVKTKIWKTL